MTTKHIAMTAVKSSQINSIGYSPDTKTLFVRFHAKTGPGSLYSYANVTPEQHAEFVKAESIGKHFAATLKGNAKHPYTKITE